MAIAFTGPLFLTSTSRTIYSIRLFLRGEYMGHSAVAAFTFLLMSFYAQKIGGWGKLVRLWKSRPQRPEEGEDGEVNGDGDGTTKGHAKQE